MPLMRIQAQCRPCLERLIDQTIALATGDPDLQAAARRQARAVLAAEFSPQAISASIANQFHQAITTVTGNPDPFRERKLAETALARSVAAALHAHGGAGSVDPLALAAAGNALDFFRSPEEIALQMRAQVRFCARQLRLWAGRLQHPGLLLYLADNAGEQFFDLPLVQALRDRGWQVLYVVKGGPIQNDLCRQDLIDSGLAAALAPVVDTGALTVGLELARTSPAFQRLFARADLILAKGMGHFETLSHLADPRLFFLLQAKCPPVAAALGVAVNAFVLSAADA